MKRNSALAILLVVILLTMVFNSKAAAQVTVIRSGEENPMVTIGKSTLYGAGTGILIGLALSLVVDEDFGDVMKWSFVGGTLGGFTIGVVHVITRSRANSSLLNFDSKGFAGFALPIPDVRVAADKSLGVRVPVVSLSFK